MVLAYSETAHRSKAAVLPPILSPELMEAVEAALLSYNSMSQENLQTEVKYMLFYAKLFDD